jgi:hypothetical protein
MLPYVSPTGEHAGDLVEHDVRAQASAAFAAFGREEGLEDPFEVGCIHADAVVGNGQQDIRAVDFGLNADQAAAAAVECVQQCVHDQVCDHMRQRAGKAVHADAGRTIHLHRAGCAFESWFQRQQDFIE